MKYKHIEASRELRLWIGQIIIPAMSLGVMVMCNPEIKSTVDNTVYNVKKSIRKIIKK